MIFRAYMAAALGATFNHGQTLFGPSIALPPGTHEIGAIALVSAAQARAEWMRFNILLNQSLDGGQTWSSLEHSDTIIPRPEFTAPSGAGQSPGNFADIFGNFDLLVPDDSWSFWSYTKIPAANYMSAKLSLQIVESGDFNYSKLGLAYIAKDFNGNFLEFDDSTLRPA